MGAFIADYITGLRLLVGDFDLLLIALQKTFLMLFFGSTFQVLLVTISETTFIIGENGSLAVGMMFATMGLGTGTSPLLARLCTKDRDLKVRAAILLGYCLAAVGLVVTGSLASFAVVLVGAFIVGSGGGLLWVFSTQLLLQLSAGPGSRPYLCFGVRLFFAGDCGWSSAGRRCARSKGRDSRDPLYDGNRFSRTRSGLGTLDVARKDRSEWRRSALAGPPPGKNCQLGCAILNYRKI